MKTKYYDRIRVWRADDKEMKSLAKKPSSKKKEKLSEDELQNMCDLALLISLEEYFEDIEYESPYFLILNQKVKRLKEESFAKVQAASDKKISNLMKKIPDWYKDSKVIIDYHNHLVTISDGITKLFFILKYENSELNVRYKAITINE